MSAYTLYPVSQDEEYDKTKLAKYMQNQITFEITKFYDKKKVVIPLEDVYNRFLTLRQDDNNTHTNEFYVNKTIENLVNEFYNNLKQIEYSNFLIESYEKGLSYNPINNNLPKVRVKRDMGFQWMSSN